MYLIIRINLSNSVVGGLVLDGNPKNVISIIGSKSFTSTVFQILLHKGCCAIGGYFFMGVRAYEKKSVSLLYAEQSCVARAGVYLQQKTKTSRKP